MSRKQKLGLGVATIWLIASVATWPPRGLHGPPMMANVPMSAGVRRTLDTACRDCHSDEPRVPWYSYFAPVSWRVREHIVKGRERLNLSQWQQYPPVRQLRLLSDMTNAIQTLEMPTADYLLMHPDARLTESDEREFVAWSQAERARLIAAMANPTGAIAGQQHPQRQVAGEGPVPPKVRVAPEDR